MSHKIYLIALTIFILLIAFLNFDYIISFAIILPLYYLIFSDLDNKKIFNSFLITFLLFLIFFIFFFHFIKREKIDEIEEILDGKIEKNILNNLFTIFTNNLFLASLSLFISSLTFVGGLVLFFHNLYLLSYFTYHYANIFTLLFGFAELYIYYYFCYLGFLIANKIYFKKEKEIDINITKQLAILTSFLFVFALLESIIIFILLYK